MALFSVNSRKSEVNGQFCSQFLFHLLIIYFQCIKLRYSDVQDCPSSR
jgi:hypothetical protein